MAHIHYMKLDNGQVIITAKVGRNTKHGSAIVKSQLPEGKARVPKDEMLEMVLELKDKANNR